LPGGKAIAAILLGMRVSVEENCKRAASVKGSQEASMLLPPLLLLLLLLPLLLLLSPSTT
jgi:hypothetical protein